MLYAVGFWDLMFLATVGPLWGFIVGYWIIPRLFPKEKRGAV